MLPSILDNPILNSAVFHPRTTHMPVNARHGIFDGLISIEGDVSLGYRLYANPQWDKPVLLYFHGNGEVATDYDDIAPYYHEAGVSLLVIDYRGYGWSTGMPKVSTLSSDAEPVVRALPDVLARAGIVGVPLFVMGRSLGSAPAIHSAYTFPGRFKGLIVESGFAEMPSIFLRAGLTLAQLAGQDEPVANARKMRSIQTPLLVIHGEDDTLLPVENGQALFDASPSPHKTILRVPNAGHNDLLWRAGKEYFAAIRNLVLAFIAG